VAIHPAGASTSRELWAVRPDRHLPSRAEPQALGALVPPQSPRSSPLAGRGACGTRLGGETFARVCGWVRQLLA